MLLLNFITPGFKLLYIVDPASVAFVTVAFVSVPPLASAFVDTVFVKLVIISPLVSNAAAIADSVVNVPGAVPVKLFKAASTNAVVATC